MFYYLYYDFLHSTSLYNLFLMSMLFTTCNSDLLQCTPLNIAQMDHWSMHRAVWCNGDRILFLSFFLTKKKVLKKISSL